MVQPELIEEEERCIICGAPTSDYVCPDCEYWHYGRGMEEDETHYDHVFGCGEEEDD